MRFEKLLKLFLGLMVVCLSCGCASQALAAKTDQPNFIIIFIDDLGYGDLGCFGHPTIRTPNLDRMAQEGMKLTQFYVAASVCSPSRAALMTGRLPVRTSVTGVLFPKNKKGLPQTEVTIAKALKQHGYATACVGKWHMGHTDSHLPTDHGFDSYFGIPYSNDMTVDPKMSVADDALFREGMTLQAMRTEEPKKNWVPILRNKKIVEYPADQTTLTQRYTDESIQFIKKNKDRPFFLYLAQTMPHIPLFASEQFKDISLRGLYGDTVEEIDASTGRVLETLKQEGLDQKTFVLFTSDNGPWLGRKLDGGSQGLFKGGKFTTWEGGMREPCLVRWPGVIPAGTVNMSISSTLDVLPTVMDFAGAEMPKRVLDGYSLKTMLTENKQGPRQMMFYYHGNKLRAVRHKQWKLHLEATESEISQTYKKLDKPILFNLEQDPGEKYDIAKDHPDIVESIMKIIENHKKVMPGK